MEEKKQKQANGLENSALGTAMLGNFALRHNRQVRTRFCRTNLGCCHVKILVKPLGFTLFLPCTHQKFVPAKFFDLWCAKY